MVPPDVVVEKSTVCPVSAGFTEDDAEKLIGGSTVTDTLFEIA